MPEAGPTMEKLAARIVDGQAVNWQEADAACTSDEERAFVRNLKIVTDVALQSDPAAVQGVPTLRDAATPGSAMSTVPPAASHPFAAGTQWGPLEIIDPIGAGGFGQVYRARDRKLDRVVALKLMHLEERILEDRALSDGRLLARVIHRNVVTVHGAERIGDHVGIWMDYIAGETLEKVLEHSGPLGTREAIGIGIELCGALAAVHKAGLVHGDIKAQNVMKERGGRLVLMDFGAAHEASPGSHADSRISGTPLYMPPEVFEGQPMTIVGDIYALGVLLHHLVTRSFPVKAGSIDDLRLAHARGERALLRDERPDLENGFVRVVEKALSRDPAERFASAGQMQQALEGSLRMEPAQEAPPQRFPWSLVVAALGAATVLVVAGVIWMKSPSGVALTTGSPARVPAAPAATPGAYSISAALYRSGSGGRERLVPGSRIGVGDALNMDVETSDALYLYVLNHDQQGRTATLFPRPDCDLSNPLPAGKHTLPGRRIADGKPLDWTVDTAGGREQILMLASRTPLDFVEEAIARLPKGEQYAQLPPAAAITLRGIGGVAPQPAGAAPPDAARLFEDIKRLADSPELASGTWMRQIDLENPPAR